MPPQIKNTGHPTLRRLLIGVQKKFVPQRFQNDELNISAQYLTRGTLPLRKHSLAQPDQPAFLLYNADACHDRGAPLFF